MTGRNQLATTVGVLGFAAALFMGGRLLLSDELSPVGIGVKAPSFTAVTLDSVPVRKTLDDYRGEVVMVNIWATWCGPCRIEMPSIELLHQAYAGKGLKILAVSIDEPGTEAQIRDFVKQYNLTFQILHDQEKEIARDYQTSGYPETFIVDRNGVIVKKLLGATDWNSPENRRLIQSLLARKSG